jgi:hypothetical protein
MMEAVTYLLPGKAAQRRHPTDKGIPRNIFPGVGVRLDPQAITNDGDRTLEQLGPPGLGFEEALEGIGRRLGHSILPLQL